MDFFYNWNFRHWVEQWWLLWFGYKISIPPTKFGMLKTWSPAGGSNYWEVIGPHSVFIRELIHGWISNLISFLSELWEAALKCGLAEGSRPLVVCPRVLYILTVSSLSLFLLPVFERVNSFLLSHSSVLKSLLYRRSKGNTISCLRTETP